MPRTACAFSRAARRQFHTLEGLQESFGSHVVATEIPIGAEHEVGGVIDLIDMRAFLHDSDGRGEEVEAEIPAELQELAQQYREKLMDEVAENSDALMEHYLEGEEISHEETVAALKKGVTEGHLFPVTCGIATRDLGIERLLQALIEDLPSPAMRGARTLLGEEDAEVEVLPDEDGPLIAQVFKTTADPFTGRHNALRVLSGTLRSDSHVHNERTGAKERIGQLGQPLGKELSTTDELGAGDDRRQRPVEVAEDRGGGGIAEQRSELLPPPASARSRFAHMRPSIAPVPRPTRSKTRVRPQS